MAEYSLGLYEKAMPATLSWSERLNAAREAGFDQVEISIDETDARLARLWDRTEITGLRDAVRATEVPVRTMCLSGHRKFPLGSEDEAVRRKALEIMERAIDFAAQTGVRIIQLAGYDVYYDPSTARTRALFEEGLAASCDMAAKSGVLLGFETMETPFMNTVEKAMRYVRLLDSPYLQVYPDIGNLTNAAHLYGGDVGWDLRAGKGHLAAVHLKETVEGKYREILFGTGWVDFDACIREAVSLGVRTFTGEFWYVGSPAWKEDLRFASGFLRNYLDHAYTKQKKEIAV